MNATDNPQPAPAMILGEVASSGLARGRALLCDCAKQTVVPRRQVSEAEAQKELERFDAAVAAAEQKLLAGSSERPAEPWERRRRRFLKRKSCSCATRNCGMQSATFVLKSG